MAARCKTGFDLDNAVLEAERTPMISENAAESLQRSVALQSAERARWQHFQTCPGCKREDNANEAAVRSAYAQLRRERDRAPEPLKTHLQADLDNVQQRLMEK